MPTIEPTIVEVLSEKRKDPVASVDLTDPKTQIRAIPYWVMVNGEAKVEHIYFKPLYIVVN